MGRWAKLRWPLNAWDRTLRIGEKNGRKRSVLVDERGVPLSLTVSGANVPDVKHLEKLLDGIAISRPEPDEAHPQNLCADAGYMGKAAMQAVVDRNYQPHIKQRRDEAEAKRTQPGYKPRRWTVERTHSWFNRYRKLLVSFEKTTASYISLLALAAALTAWRQTITIYG